MSTLQKFCFISLNHLDHFAFFVLSYNFSSNLYERELMKVWGIVALMCLFVTSVFAKSFNLASPDGKLEAKIDVTRTLNFSIKFDGEELAKDCEIALYTSLGKFGVNPKFSTQKTSSVKKTIKPTWGTKAQILDNFNRLVLKFDGYSVEFRAYNDAFAYRFISEKKGEIIVNSETAKFPFDAGCDAYVHKVGSFHCFFEDNYRRLKLADINRQTPMVAIPFVFDAGKVRVAILDSDVTKYPKMNLKVSAEGVISGAYAPYPKEMEKKGGLLMPKTTEPYIAKSEATRTFPWRAILFARSDKELVENDIQYKLSSPSKIKDTSWIELGTCAWDWWNNWGLFGVDFEAGQNMDTYKYYIDFASKFGMKYFLLDEGWLGNNDEIATRKPKVDIKELVEYAKAKNVKLLLWALVRPFNYDAAKILDRAKEWGVAGMKIDFMERDDQQSVDLFEEIARLAAERKLIIDFHGCAPSSGLHRTYPNVVNFEGVRGGENNKGHGVFAMTPSHNVDLVFTRSLAGPMDYTAGAMLNLGRGRQNCNPIRPYAQGTRAHQMAMYVCYFEPLKMLSDSPTEYEKEPDCATFMGNCPTVWDETKVLDGKIGEYVVMLRRSGKTWYIGAMSGQANGDKEIEISLNFLPNGEFEMESFADGKNSHRIGYDYKREVKTVKSDDKLKIKMSRVGGGFAAKLTPKSAK